MSAAANTAGVDVDLLDDPLWIMDCKVPQLKAAWKQLDQSGFEPASAKHLRLALLKRAYYKLFATEQESTSSLDEDETSLPSPSVSANKVSPPSGSKSYKEAVTTDQSLGQSVTQNEQSKDRLAQLEVTLKDQQRKLAALERKAEATDRRERELDLVLYNIPEMLDDHEDQVAIHSLVEGRHDMTVASMRIGERSSRQGRPRPALIRFDTMDDKHTFLKHAKELKPGIKWDDYLTRQQQKERQVLAADLHALRTKGFRPFFRGSQLKYRNANKTKNCRLGQAIKVVQV